MPNTPKKSALAAIGLGGLLAVSAAHAQSTWNLIPTGSSGAACTQVTGTGSYEGNFGNSYTCSGTGNAGTSLTAYAFSTRDGSGTSRPQAVTASQYANAYLSPQGTSGFGVANRVEGVGVSPPDHAVDNNPTGVYDMVVLNFNASVVLDLVGIGYSNSSTGSDMTIMRWTGSGSPLQTTTPAPTVGGDRALARSGWTLVSSLADVTADNSNPYGGAARETYADPAQGSSWWMISAFNTTLNTGNKCYKDNAGGTYDENQKVGSSSYRCDDGDDYFKINYLTTLTPSSGPPTGGVPTPGTLALACLGLLGAGVTRRRMR